jgi:hypothetical protein
VAEVKTLNLRPESFRKLMRDNALAVFDRLPQPRVATRKQARSAAQAAATTRRGR